MPKKKSGPSGSGGQQPRPPSPKKKATKRPEQTSPKRGTGAKKRAIIEAASSSESEGEAPAPAPAAAQGVVPMKRCGACAACRQKRAPKLPCSAPVPRATGSGRSRKPKASNEADVPIRAKIIDSEGAAQDSVPVPDDTDKRSVAVQLIVRMRTKPGDPPDTLVDKAMAAWLAKRNPPNQWLVVNAATGKSLGAHVVPITVSVDKAMRRASVAHERVQDALRKHRNGAVSKGAFRPDYGTNARRLLTGNAENGLQLFLKAYRESVAAECERKCNGTALQSDKGVVVEATKGSFPSILKSKFTHAESDLYILRSTIEARNGSHLWGGWLFADETMQGARRQCLRQVRISA